MRFPFIIFILIFGISIQPALAQAPSPSLQSANPAGRWLVKFTLAGIGEKNLIFDSQTKGSGSFLLLDADPDNKAAPVPLPAAWSQTTDERVNFSGEVELPIGVCCREVGTLIFKGKFTSDNSISGKAIFVGSTVDDESLNGFRSATGSFTATRAPKVSRPSTAKK